MTHITTPERRFTRMPGGGCKRIKGTFGSTCNGPGADSLELFSHRADRRCERTELRDRTQKMAMHRLEAHEKAAEQDGYFIGLNRAISTRRPRRQAKKQSVEQTRRYHLPRGVRIGDVTTPVRFYVGTVQIRERLREIREECRQKRAAQ